MAGKTAARHNTRAARGVVAQKLIPGSFCMAAGTRSCGGLWLSRVVSPSPGGFREPRGGRSVLLFRPTLAWLVRYGRVNGVLPEACGCLKPVPGPHFGCRTVADAPTAGRFYPLSMIILVRPARRAGEFQGRVTRSARSTGRPTTSRRCGDRRERDNVHRAGT